MSESEIEFGPWEIVKWEIEYDPKKFFRCFECDLVYEKFLSDEEVDISIQKHWPGTTLTASRILMLCESCYNIREKFKEKDMEARKKLNEGGDIK